MSLMKEEISENVTEDRMKLERLSALPMTCLLYTSQPTFSIIAKNAEIEQKKEFIDTIENSLKEIVKQGMDKKALQAGINYYEFKYREADFGNYPKGLMYGIQMFDSWLYDENRPFLHIQAGETFEYLKAQINTGYFENLIDQYLLNNPHSSIVIAVPKKGLTTRRDKELENRLKEYKETLSKEELSLIHIFWGIKKEFLRQGDILHI